MGKKMSLAPMGNPAGFLCTRGGCSENIGDYTNLPEHLLSVHGGRTNTGCGQPAQC